MATLTGDFAEGFNFFQSSVLSVRRAMLISGGVLSPRTPFTADEPLPFPRFFIPFLRLAVVAFINYIAVRSSRAIATTKQCQRRTPLSPPDKIFNGSV